MTNKIFAIYYAVSGDDEGVYVKWRSQKDAKGNLHWDVTPVQTYSEASKYATQRQAEYAIKNVPSFQTEFITAIVVTE